ncbi:MAG: hypothetical protein M3081_19355 [Gemmatimonadota bacterium]|nr:hypothetical protein [Gemmatimonadota bacterium]
MREHERANALDDEVVPEAIHHGRHLLRPTDDEKTRISRVFSSLGAGACATVLDVSTTALAIPSTMRLMGMIVSKDRAGIGAPDWG